MKATTIWAEPDYRAEVAALAIAKAAKNTQRVVEQSLSCLWPPGLAKSAVANLGQAAVLDLVALKADDPGEPAAAPVFDPWAAAADAVKQKKAAAAAAAAKAEAKTQEDAQADVQAIREAITEGIKCEVSVELRQI